MYASVACATAGTDGPMGAAGSAVTGFSSTVAAGISPA